MGIGFVFLIYLVVLAVLMVPAVSVCAALGYFMTRGNSEKVRRKILVGSFCLPVVGAVYLVGCIIVMAIVGYATGHDAGFGDDFELPLHNGYRWSAIDTTISARVDNQDDLLATDGKGDPHLEKDDKKAFDNVVALQEEGDWLAGGTTSDDNSYRDTPQNSLPPDHWFLFNTRTHQSFDAGSEAELQADAKAQGFGLRLESSGDFYWNHRRTWVGDGVILILLILPMSGGFFVWGWVRRVLREDEQ